VSKIRHASIVYEPSQNWDLDVTF